MPAEVFLAWSGQPIDHNSNNVEYVRRVYQRTEIGNKALASWIALHRGSIIAQAGAEGKAVLPKNALDELSKIKEQYEQALGCPISFGIGDSLSEAVKAVALAALKGIGQTVIYSPNQEKTLNDLQDPKKESDDILLKSGEQVPHAKGTSPGQSHLGKPAAPIQDEGIEPPVTEESRPEQSKPPEWDPDKQSAGDIANLLNTYAQPSDVQSGPDLSALKQETGVILKQIKELVPNIEELQSQFPELYQGYLLLVQAFIELNKQTPESMSKSEKSDEAELIEKAVDSFTLSEFAPEDEKVKEYSKLKTEAPPIFMVGDKVIDGKKRLSAAKAKGDKTVKVYLAKAGFVLGRGMSKLPVGTLWQGRQKQLDPETGTPKYKMLLSGMIASHNQDPNVSSIPRAISPTRPND